MSQGLTLANELYVDRGKRAKELEAEGNRVIGYLCSLTPVEMITAAGLIPFRIMGSRDDPITIANEYLEVIACPFVRSTFDMALKGDYAFLNGFVVPHACDNIVKLYEIWPHNLKPAYAHFVNVPHTLSPPSYRFLEAELTVFKRSLERFIGRQITSEEIIHSIHLHNRQRSLVRQLYELRKHDPPAISGSEMTRVMLAVVSLPVTEANGLLQDVISEVTRRDNAQENKAARLMIAGTGNDDTSFIEMVEQSGADVVVDDLCFGTKPYWYDVEVTDSPLDGLARSYLEKVNCPRTYRQSPGTHEEDLENRFGYIYDFARDFNVNGVILYLLRYCDTHALDAPDLKEYLRGKGLPVLLLEEDYPTVSIGRLKTRVQAFLEMIA